MIVLKLKYAFQEIYFVLYEHPSHPIAYYTQRITKEKVLNISFEHVGLLSREIKWGQNP